jgi:FkbM family methyltransferase
MTAAKSSAMSHFLNAFRPIHFRGKARLLNAVSPTSGVRHSRIFGSVFELDLADFIQRRIYLGTFEPADTRLVQKYLGPGMTFVDVGANVGYYTALAAQLVGSAGRVIAFEPSPYAFKRLEAMLRANSLQQSTAVHAGLSDSAGQAKLYLGIDSHNHTPTMAAHENTTATDITIETLDDQADRLGIDRIHLMKIDVEGHETKVLAGAKRLLSEARIRAVLCEFNEHWLCASGSSSRDLERVLREAGFVECEQVLRGGENRFFRLEERA